MKKKKTGILAEFKTFAMRGNVIDLAVGVIIGTAFGSITNSLVGDVFLPFIGLFLGGVDFSELTLQLGPLWPGAETASIKIGAFIQTVIDFLILAFVVFCFVKVINKLRDWKKNQEEHSQAVPELSGEEKLLMEIRDLLKEQHSEGDDNDI